MSLTTAAALRENTDSSSLTVGGHSSMTTADSSRSLMTFFTAAAETGTGADVEGKNFFDSFSTGIEQEEQPSSASLASLSPRLSLTSQNQNFFSSIPAFNNQVPDVQQTHFAETGSQHSVVQEQSDPISGACSEISQPGTALIYPSPSVASQSGLTVQFDGTMASPPVGECSWIGSYESQDRRLDAAEVADSNRCHNAWIAPEAAVRIIAQKVAAGSSTSVQVTTVCPSVIVSNLLVSI